MSAKILVDVRNEVDSTAFNRSVVCSMIQKEFRESRLKKTVQTLIQFCAYPIDTSNVWVIESPVDWGIKARTVTSKYLVIGGTVNSRMRITFVRKVKFAIVQHVRTKVI